MILDMPIGNTKQLPTYFGQGNLWAYLMVFAVSVPENVNLSCPITTSMQLSNPITAGLNLSNPITTNVNLSTTILENP